MNDRKLDQLFHAARHESPAAPPEGFELQMLQAIHRESVATGRETIPIFDQLNAWFPRLAWAAAAIIALSVAADYGLTATGTPGLNDGVSQVSAHWLLSANGF